MRRSDGVQGMVVIPRIIIFIIVIIFIILRTLRVAPPPPLFLYILFGIDFDVSSRLEASRLEIIDADTQDRFVY